MSRYLVLKEFKTARMGIHAFPEQQALQHEDATDARG
jgi:hypothetical protein